MKQQIHVFTSAACNYLPKARVLACSVRKFHPEWRIHLALADKMCEMPADTPEYFDEIHPASSLEIRDYPAWSFGYTLVEHATAIKPFMLKLLLKRDDCRCVFYLDPDIVLFSPLTDIIDRLDQASVALTPHLTEPESTLEGIVDNEICSLRHGIYNLGFLGVRPVPEGFRFASWWADRVYHFCQDDIPNGLFTDQRWIDLVPAFFRDVAILTSPRHNVATWNISNRNLSGEIPEKLQINGEPLGFYHFTGFDKGAHLLMADKYGSHQALLAQLISWYIGQCDKQSLSVDFPAEWALSRFENGPPVLPEMRKIYQIRKDLWLAFPDPTEASAAGFQSWWQNHAATEYPALFPPQHSKLPIEKQSHKNVFKYLITKIHKFARLIQRPLIISELLT
jgi:hypothetical protein